jgi:hypothetical protein
LVGADGVTPICGIYNNTYGAAFLDNEGEIYLFFRSTEYDIPNVTYPGIPNPGYSDKTKWRFYAPEVYLKSSNNGLTWTGPKKVIDPGMPSIFSGQTVLDVAGCTKIWTAKTAPINDTLYTSIYPWEFEPDKSRNGVHLGWSATYTKRLI